MVFQKPASRLSVLSVTSKLLGVSLYICWAVLSGLSSAQIANPPSGTDAGSFTVSGTVVNSVTGAPVGRALVRVFAVVPRTAFTDSEGHFQIEGVQEVAGLAVQKPGYFSPQELDNSGRSRLTIGPQTGPMVLKLTPQSAISGRVTDAAGEPIERMPVNLTERTVREGRRRWDSRGFAQTDEDGKFRFSNLMPGTYYLAVGPAREEERLLARDEKPKTGYPNVYYPGVSDFTAASPIQVVAGQNAEANLAISAVPVYRVSGTVIGYPVEQGVGVQILDQLGQALPLAGRFSADTGTFDFENIPPGSYVLKASSQAGDKPLRAETRLNVSTNLDNVHLALGPAILIPVQVRLEARDSSNLTSPAWSQQRPPVSVRLIPLEMLTAEASSTSPQQRPGHEAMVLPDVEPGKYAANVMTWGPWYVQSAGYGPTNLLSDDLTVAPAQNYPIEIVLRDDAATLTGDVKSSDGTEAPATVLVVPQSSRRSVKLGQAFPPNGFTMRGLAPGEYLVFAFDRADKIEYANADVLQPYASQATHVTLAPNQETRVTLNLIHAGDGE